MNMIKVLRDQLGMTQFELADRAGTSQPQIRRLELGMRKLTKEWAERIAPHLHVTPEVLLFGYPEGQDRKPNEHENNINNPDLALAGKMNVLKVIGTIKAGHFKDITMFDNDSSEYNEIYVPADSRFPKDIQYSLKIDGDSMNLKFPDGSYVIVIDLIGSGVELKPGMTVHVERTFGGGQYVETTLKEIQSINGKTELVPRSTNPVHKPIIIEGGEDMEVQIRGVVIGAYQLVPFV